MKFRGRLVAKRLIDVTLASIGLAVGGPLLLAGALLVRIALGRPIFFIQARPGRNGTPFNMIKLRTMRIGDEPDSVRLTKTGTLLRSSSIDELPQLINVLRGDMSIVGPRPLLMRYSDYLTADERARFLVRPGITGLAQVSGRNQLSWSERLSLDAIYASSWTVGGDIRIIVKTFAVVVRKRGFASDPGAIMENLDVERSRLP